CRTNASVLTFIFIFFCVPGDQRDLHSFPTRRSSDLTVLVWAAPVGNTSSSSVVVADPVGATPPTQLVPVLQRLLPPAPVQVKVRSEEHTSELQSRSDLVCRLLLEKKKIRAD